MNSIFGLCRSNTSNIVWTLSNGKCYKSNYDLYVDYIHKYLNDNELDDVSTKIVTSESYTRNTNSDVYDLCCIEGVPQIERVLIQTIIDIDETEVWYYMFENINNNTLLLFIDSFLITQDIMDTLVKYYSVLRLGSNNLDKCSQIISKLQSVCKTNGLIHDDSSDNYEGDHYMMNILVL